MNTFIGIFLGLSIVGFLISFILPVFANKKYGVTPSDVFKASVGVTGLALMKKMAVISLLLGLLIIGGAIYLGYTYGWVILTSIYVVCSVGYMLLPSTREMYSVIFMKETDLNGVQ